MKDNKDNILNGEQEYLLETEEPLAEALKMKLDKVKTLKDSGKNLYATKFDKNTDINDIREKYCNLTTGEKAEGTFRLAGRLMIFRRHGKATFCDMQDATGKIQLEHDCGSFLKEHAHVWVIVIGRSVAPFTAIIANTKHFISPVTPFTDPSNTNVQNGFWIIII